MSASKGYYSLIQFCPDLGRSESVNVGVLLLCPERRFLGVLTDRALKRVCTCFAATEGERVRISALRESIERRLKVEAPNIRDLDDLNAFIESRGNAIQLTQPRPMKVYDAERDLRRLFEQLVEPPMPLPTEHLSYATPVYQRTRIQDLLSPGQHTDASDTQPVGDFDHPVFRDALTGSNNHSNGFPLLGSAQDSRGAGIGLGGQ